MKTDRPTHFELQSFLLHIVLPWAFTCPLWARTLPDLLVDPVRLLDNRVLSQILHTAAAVF